MQQRRKDSGEQEQRRLPLCANVDTEHDFEERLDGSGVRCRFCSRSVLDVVTPMPMPEPPPNRIVRSPLHDDVKRMKAGIASSLRFVTKERPGVDRVAVKVVWCAVALTVAVLFVVVVIGVLD